jgi:Arc/MetJ family transcription regulator
MRTTIDIDEELLADAKRLSNGKSKRAIVEEALREFVNAKKREKLIEMIGSREFEIDLTLEDLRRMRGCDEPPLSD